MTRPQDLNLLPIPADLTLGKGRTTIGPRFSFSLSWPPDPRIESSLQRFFRSLSRETGLKFTRPMAAKTHQAVLRLKWQGSGLDVQTPGEDESYHLRVGSSGVELTAPDPLGILRGLETLRQLVYMEGGEHHLPAVVIRDRPRFPWRGLLIDASRHWQPLENILRNLEAMASCKMNVLHWHLTDDQGFRAESLLFPRLHRKGSDGLFYTQDQMRRVVSAARGLGIRVVPEFDIPGHATSWLVGYPELGSKPGPYGIERNYSIFKPTLDPTNEALYGFLDGFLGEMAAIFPDPYLHIGGDEVKADHWNANPRIRAFIRRNGMKDHEGLQAHFNRRLLTILEKHGKKMMGWDEVLHPGLPKDVVVQSWRGAKSLAASARRGYDALLSHGYYLDLAEPASSLYQADPLPSGHGLTAQQRSHVLGGEACLWSELVSAEMLDSRVWPRTLAVAERLWSPASTRDIDDLYRRMDRESVRLATMGLRHLSTSKPMLERMAGGKVPAPLAELAEVLEPAKYYFRHRTKKYTSRKPLDRLVDAVQVESRTARDFGKAVDRFLSNAPELGPREGLWSSLKRWVDNEKALGPWLGGLRHAAEVRMASRRLGDVARVGWEALDHLGTGLPAPADWAAQSLALLDEARYPHGEVEIAVLPGVLKLVLAAAQWARIKGSPSRWNRSLDGQVEAKRPKRAM